MFFHWVRLSHRIASQHSHVRPIEGIWPWPDGPWQSHHQSCSPSLASLLGTAFIVTMEDLSTEVALEHEVGVGAGGRAQEIRL